MSEDMEALYEASFTLIGIAGDSKAESMQAIDCCKQGDFEGARKHLAAADETMVKAEQFMDLYQTVQTLKESK